MDITIWGVGSAAVEQSSNNAIMVGDVKFDHLGRPKDLPRSSKPLQKITLVLKHLMTLWVNYRIL